MSYILDALRRADAERERGHVPGLHARSASNGVDVARPPIWRAGLIGLGAGGALVLLALAIWHGRPTDDAGAASPVASLSTASALPAVTSPTPVASPVPPAARVEPPAASAPVPTLSGEPARSVPRTPAVLTPPTPRKPAATTVATSDAARPGNPGASSVTPGVARATPSALAASPVATLAELPDDIRRQLPALAIGGSAYSTRAASRFVIVNGQLFHEGDALAPGLVLEQIRLKSAVLAFKGYRYGISF